MSSLLPHEVQHKIVFLGDSNAGKTSIIHKYLNIASQPSSTVGAAAHLLAVRLPHAVLTLNCWDTAGQENYRCLVPIYARGAEVACVVFDQSNPASFQSLPDWLTYIDKEIGIKSIVIVSNKTDLETVVSFDKSQAFCCDRNLPLIATSAVTGNNIKLLFKTIAEIIYDSKYYKANLDSQIDLHDKSTGTNSCC
jgi:small GTP-binding protein